VAAVRTPSDLGVAGRKLWREIVAKMADNDTMPDARERKILHSASALADLEAELRDVLKTEPMMTTGSRGQTVMHPAVAEQRAVAHEIAALLMRIDLQSPDDDASSGGINISIATPAGRSVKARNAANARWEKG
jgi:P27 family predicted phage terminase small subunit